MGAYEAKVNPELWTNIASQVGVTSSVAATTGMSLLTKAIIGISAASILTTVVVVLSSSEPKVSKDDTKDAVTVQLQAENTPTRTDSNETPSRVNGEVDPDQQQNSNAATSNTGSENTVVTPSTVIVPSVIAKSPIDNDGNEVIPAQNIDKRIETPAERTPNVDTAAPSILDVIALPKIVIAPNPSTAETPFTIKLPNIITPNNDGANDYLVLEVGEVKSFYIKVLDQNGQMVFESNDPNFKWYGRNMFTGELVLKGIHLYYVIAEDMQGRQFKNDQLLMVIPD